MQQDQSKVKVAADDTAGTNSRIILHRSQQPSVHYSMSLFYLEGVEVDLLSPSMASLQRSSSFDVDDFVPKRPKY